MRKALTFIFLFFIFLALTLTFVGCKKEAAGTESIEKDIEEISKNIENLDLSENLSDQELSEINDLLS